MLKGISPLLSPELLKALDEMGHGDTLVIADGNFPAESVGKNAKVIRADGHGVPELLDAVLSLLPLDAYVDAPVSLMEVVPWRHLRHTQDLGQIQRHSSPARAGTQRYSNLAKRFAFYEEKDADLIIATGETAIYANILLQKGVVQA